MIFLDKHLDPYTRIRIAHFLVLAILLVSIYFSDNLIAQTLQLILIVAVSLHHLDDLRLKKALESSEELLREENEIYDRNVIVSEADLDGNITYVNDNFCKISGYTKEELLGRPHSILRHPDMSKEFFKDMWETLHEGKTFHGQIKNKKRSGEDYWIDASISPIRKNNIVTGYKAIRFDITEKMLSKEELQLKDQQLKEQSTRFEFAINSSRDGFWDYDISKKEFYLSKGWKKRLGFDEDEEVSYLTYLELIPQKNRFSHHNSMMDILDEHSEEIEYIHFRILYPLLTKDGEKLLIEDVGDAFFDVDHELVRLTGFHRDITEQNRQARLLASQNRLSEMGEMIGNIAHQWRQPLAAIDNTLNDLELDIELDDLESIDTKIYMQISAKVKGYTKFLSNTIDDFRKLTSDEKTKSDFSLVEVLDEAQEIVSSHYEKFKIKIRRTLSSNSSFVLHGYKRELIQVLINILNNAKDILVEKELSNPMVKIEITQEENHFKISIADNAGGIPETIIEKVFDPYFTTKHESIGTGIGLFMSRKIITEDFDGKLEVFNDEEGAVFVISLPREG